MNGTGDGGEDVDERGTGRRALGRRLRLALAAALLVVGATVALVGPAMPGVDPRPGATAVGVVVAVQALVALALARRRRPAPVDLPDPDPPSSGGTRPGAALDDAFDRFGSLDPAARERLRERVAAAAVDAVATAEGCSTPEARERVAAGDWTDDDAAVAYLDDDAPVGLGERVRGWLAGGSARERRARRAVEAVRRRRSRTREATR